MKTRLPALTLFIAAACCASFAENTQAILPHDSPIIGLLHEIYLEQGMEPLSAAAPYSTQEILVMLEKIDPESLSEAGRRAYAEIRSSLPTFAPPSPMSIRFSLRPSAAIEGYYHTNPDPSQTEWEYGYNERQPVFSLPIELWMGDGAYGVLEASVKQNHDALNAKLVPNNYTNVPMDPTTVDYNFPFRAFFAAGGPSWSFTIGRDRFSWGNGQTGDLAVSDAPDFYDFARITGFWRDFKYTALWITLPYNLDSYRFPVWGTTTVSTGVTGNNLSYDDYPRNFFLHRFDWSVFDRLSLTIIEGFMIGGVQPSLVYFNPFMIFHDTFNFHHASELLALEATYNPWRYVEIYGQAAFNQIQLPYELQRYGKAATGTPDANAVLGGMRINIPLWDGYTDAGLEGVYVSPWMYIRENRLTSYEWWRFITSNVPHGQQWVSAPLGYYEGPDTLVLFIWAGYGVPRAYSASVDYKRAVKGQQTLDTPYAEGDAAASLATPTGIAETKNVFHFRGSAEPLPFLSVNIDLYGIFTDNFNNVNGAQQSDFQAVFGVKVQM